jgi:hypothetical protein
MEDALTAIQFHVHLYFLLTQHQRTYSALNRNFRPCCHNREFRIDRNYTRLSGEQLKSMAKMWTMSPRQMRRVFRSCIRIVYFCLTITTFQHFSASVKCSTAPIFSFLELSGIFLCIFNATTLSHPVSPLGVAPTELEQKTSLVLCSAKPQNFLPTLG